MMCKTVAFNLAFGAVALLCLLHAAECGSSTGKVQGACAVLQKESANESCPDLVGGSKTTWPTNDSDRSAFLACRCKECGGKVEVLTTGRVAVCAATEKLDGLKNMQVKLTDEHLDYQAQEDPLEMYTNLVNGHKIGGKADRMVMRAGRAPREFDRIVVNRETDVLLVIDMQKDFVNPDALNYYCGAERSCSRFACPGATKASRVIEDLIDTFAAEKATIIASKDYHPRGHSSFGRFQMPVLGGAEHCLWGTEGSQMYEPLRRKLEEARQVDPHVDIVFKAMHKDIDSFGAFPYTPERAKQRMLSMNHPPMSSDGVTPTYKTVAYDYKSTTSAALDKTDYSANPDLLKWTGSWRVPVCHAGTGIDFDEYAYDIDAFPPLNSIEEWETIVDNPANALESVILEHLTSILNKQDGTASNSKDVPAGVTDPYTCTAPVSYPGPPTAKFNLVVAPGDVNESDEDASDQDGGVNLPMEMGEVLGTDDAWRGGAPASMRGAASYHDDGGDGNGGSAAFDLDGLLGPMCAALSEGWSSNDDNELRSFLQTDRVSTALKQCLAGPKGSDGKQSDGFSVAKVLKYVCREIALCSVDLSDDQCSGVVKDGKAVCQFDAGGGCRPRPHNHKFLRSHFNAAVSAGVCDQQAVLSEISDPDAPAPAYGKREVKKIRLFVTGVALDFCVLDTAINSLNAAIFNNLNIHVEAHIVWDAARPVNLYNSGKALFEMFSTRLTSEPDKPESKAILDFLADYAANPQNAFAGDTEAVATMLSEYGASVPADAPGNRLRVVYHDQISRRPEHAYYNYLTKFQGVVGLQAHMKKYQTLLDETLRGKHTDIAAKRAHFMLARYRHTCQTMEEMYHMCVDAYVADMKLKRSDLTSIKADKIHAQAISERCSVNRCYGDLVTRDVANANSNVRNQELGVSGYINRDTPAGKIFAFYEIALDTTSIHYQFFWNNMDVCLSTKDYSKNWVPVENACTEVVNTLKDLISEPIPSTVTKIMFWSGTGKRRAAEVMRQEKGTYMLEGKTNIGVFFDGLDGNVLGAISSDQKYREGVDVPPASTLWGSISKVYGTFSKDLFVKAHQGKSVEMAAFFPMFRASSQFGSAELPSIFDEFCAVPNDLTFADNVKIDIRFDQDCETKLRLFKDGMAAYEAWFKAKNPKSVLTENDYKGFSTSVQEWRKAYGMAYTMADDWDMYNTYQNAYICAPTLEGVKTPEALKAAMKPYMINVLKKLNASPNPAAMNDCYLKFLERTSIKSGSDGYTFVESGF